MHISLSLNPKTFSALKSPNFRNFLIGQSFALTGLWMHKLTNVWLVYRMTTSGFKIGLVEFASNAPIFVIGLLVGAWLDKHDIRKTLMTSQVLIMCMAAIQFTLLFLDMAAYWNILLISFSLGCINAIDLPARQTSIMLMISDKSQLKSALSLHSMVFNTSKLIGPSIAGILIYAFGEEACYIITTLSYIPVIIILSQMTFNKRPPNTSKENPIRTMLDGFAYVGKSPVLRNMFSFLVFFALFANSYAVIFPLYATEVLGGNSKLLGYLMGGIGLGAVFGAFSIASLSSLVDIPKRVLISSLVFIAFMVMFAFSPNAFLSVLLTVPVGFGLAATFVGTNTLVQSIADEDKRGRVVSIYVVCNVGIAPIGVFIAGYLSDLIGAKDALLLGLVVMMCGAILLKFKQKTITAELNRILPQDDQ